MQELPIILVVEDDDPIQDIVEGALTEGGFEAAIAASGEEAVTLLQSSLVTYRALVTDIGLKGQLDGWEVAKKANTSRHLHERRARPILGVKGSAE